MQINTGGRRQFYAFKINYDRHKKKCFTEKITKMIQILRINANDHMTDTSIFSHLKSSESEFDQK